MPENIDFDPVQEPLDQDDQDDLAEPGDRDDQAWAETLAGL